MKSAMHDKLITVLKDAGCELVRRNGHDIFKSPINNHTFPVPRKLDDRVMGNNILKQAGITNLKL